uniref:Uncharacterized protein n=1 Tax=Brassica oleracea TaxID=3712 RepID=A0A3P6FBC1_BRAOL|nr:unnamed protein product [Brassica oleracea]
MTETSKRQVREMIDSGSSQVLIGRICNLRLNPVVEPALWHVDHLTQGFSVSEAILCATRYPSILSIKSPSESLVEDLRVPNPEGGFDFLVKIDKLVRSRMDPATEIRETKKKGVHQYAHKRG